MKIKVCGMKYPGNIREVSELKPDLMGFIFFKGSPRYVEPDQLKPRIEPVTDILKVGVFVNQPVNELIRICKMLRLDYAQLHGQESRETGQQVKREGIKTIRVFSIHDGFDWSQTTEHHDYADLYLFDTAGSVQGGTGLKFRWSQLQDYTGETPFLLSGGIGPDDASQIRHLHHPQLWGVDVNSRFEVKPGEKNILRLEQFIKDLRNEK